MWAYSTSQPGGVSWPAQLAFIVANVYAGVLLTIVVRLHNRSLPYPRRLVAALTLLDHVIVIVLAMIDAGIESRLLGVLVLVVTTDAARRGVRAAVQWALLDAATIAIYGLVVDVARGDLASRIRLVAWWDWLLIGGAVLAGVIARAAFDFRQSLEEERHKVDVMARAESDRRAFLAVLSHELRTPLSSIAALCGALARPDGIGDAGVRDEAVNLIASHATHLNGLMEDIQRLSRGDAPTERVVRPTIIEVGKLVRESASAAGVDFGRLRIDLDLAPDKVVTDPGKLRRVLTNLLENAARHSPGVVEVAVRELVERVEFSILDRGTGISPEIADQVFERGFTFGHQRDSSGLGLWIVRELTHQLGGSVAALPRPGGGVHVVVQVPSGLASRHGD